MLIQNFKSYIFAFLTIFDFKSFGGVLWPLSFFSWIKINFAFQKPLADFFLVKPWPLQQPPEAKLLISLCLLKGPKFSFKCKLSFELQFALLGWDLTNFYSKETRIVENASLCSVHARIDVIPIFLGKYFTLFRPGIFTISFDNAKTHILQFSLKLKTLTVVRVFLWGKHKVFNLQL